MREWDVYFNVQKADGRIGAQIRKAQGPTRADRRRFRPIFKQPRRIDGRAGTQRWSFIAVRPEGSAARAGIKRVTRCSKFATWRTPRAAEVNDAVLTNLGKLVPDQRSQTRSDAWFKPSSSPSRRAPSMRPTTWWPTICFERASRSRRWTGDPVRRRGEDSQRGADYRRGWRESRKWRDLGSPFQKAAGGTVELAYTTSDGKTHTTPFRVSAFAADTDRSRAAKRESFPSTGASRGRLKPPAEAKRRRSGYHEGNAAPS